MKKLLVVKLASLGDVLASTPLFSSFSHLGYEVHHLVMRNCSVITRNNPFVAQQHIVDNFPSSSLLRDIETLRNVYRIMRDERYDAVLILHLHPLFQILAKLSGIKTVIGFNNRMATFLDISSRYEDRHINRTVQEVLLAQKFESSVAMPKNLEFYPSLSTSLKLNLPDLFLACNIGGASNIHSSMPNRRWSVQSFIELFRRLSLPIVLLGNGDDDLQLASLITRQLPNITDLVNKTTFDETALVIQKSRLYLGNDSSLLFLAAAMKKPTVGLFGPTPHEAANPIGACQYAVASSLECSPCYVPSHGTKGLAYTCSNNLCMQQISVDTVYQAILTALENTSC